MCVFLLFEMIEIPIPSLVRMQTPTTPVSKVVVVNDHLLLLNAGVSISVPAPVDRKISGSIHDIHNMHMINQHTYNYSHSRGNTGGSIAVGGLGKDLRPACNNNSIEMTLNDFSSVSREVSLKNNVSNSVSIGINMSMNMNHSNTSVNNNVNGDRNHNAGTSSHLFALNLDKIQEIEEYSRVDDDVQAQRLQLQHQLHHSIPMSNINDDDIL